jgi:hypothetical protein
MDESSYLSYLQFSYEVTLPSVSSQNNASVRTKNSIVLGASENATARSGPTKSRARNWLNREIALRVAKRLFTRPGSSSPNPTSSSSINHPSIPIIPHRLHLPCLPRLPRPPHNSYCNVSPVYLSSKINLRTSLLSKPYSRSDHPHRINNRPMKL